MNVWQTLIAFFEALSQGFSLGKQLAPTDAMKDEKMNRQKKRLEAVEYVKQLRRFKRWMITHPRQSVDACINLFADGYDPDDIEDFRAALYELFPRRKHVKT